MCGHPKNNKDTNSGKCVNKEISSVCFKHHFWQIHEHQCHKDQCHYVNDSKILHANAKLIELREIEYLIKYIYKNEQKHIDACNYENRFHFEYPPDTIKYVDSLK